MALPSDPDHDARETLRLIGPDPQNWVPDRDGIDHNVFIVGGGQTGATFAFALRRAGRQHNRRAKVLLSRCKRRTAKWTAHASMSLRTRGVRGGAIARAPPAWFALAAIGAN
jgi:FAD-dependent urate hydroxylase